MGQSCSCVQVVEAPSGDDPELGRHGGIASCPDPLIYDLVRRASPHQSRGQHHLLYKKGKVINDFGDNNRNQQGCQKATRLVLRRVKPEAGNQSSFTHIYAIRSPEGERPEQRPTPSGTKDTSPPSEPDLSTDPYMPTQMAPAPRKQVSDWVCVNEELDIYVCDTGLTSSECDQLVYTSEQVCKGHYAAYTYAKQTLGCREFPTLAHACYEPVHRVTHAIWDHFETSKKLQLDDREPHIVKYDVTKKERQKLDMHTDKSEWTFLIALSDGCGLDYEGGGTYFEALDATVHVQRGHALIFPGKLRHCGQRITKGLRFLLVGFLVDKANPNNHVGGLLPSHSNAAAEPAPNKDKSLGANNSEEISRNSGRATKTRQDQHQKG